MGNKESKVASQNATPVAMDAALDIGGDFDNIAHLV
jgi:hypothetical protein